ncbi:hypothetical protein MATL_G00126360 [Megalops atlanticus]|uniref:Ig-like domain-containing protein n=1 Tax=Megalops atlanticus TaxID=7932 RepID=A0A9D3PUP9_MEGAT|nr:hypothetical protein MATL_G00126360 [Megalops atlanticus]
MFWIVIDDFDKYSYRDNKVSIVIKDSPEPPSLTVSEHVKAGEAVSASCSASHSCPSDPPLLTWSHRGTLTVQSEQLKNGQWRVTSQLTFTPTIADHNKNLTCTAQYSKTKTAQDSKILNIKYAPVSVRVDAELTVKEGDTVRMQCSSDSNPAATYQWQDAAGVLQSEGETYTLQNVSRHTGAFYCTASNAEGQRNSTPVKINVEYPPEVKQGSACATTISGVTCLCIVDSNPPCQIEWLLPGETLPRSSTERHGSVTLSTLLRSLGSHTVTCHASNSHGNTTETFFLPQNEKLLYSLIPVVTVLLIVVMAILVWVAKRHWCNNDQPVTAMKDIATVMEKTSYAETSRKVEKNCTNSFYADPEFSPSIYGNIEAENCDIYVNQEDATYANI